MSQKNNSYKLTVKSSTDQLVAIRDFIKDHAIENEIPQPVIESIILAADEAATNIVKHAYHLEATKDILVNFAVNDNECCVTLTDYGDSFDPSLISEPDMKEYLKQRRVGGLGLYLIRTLMDSMEYKSSADHHNDLTIKKRYK